MSIFQRKHILSISVCLLLVVVLGAAYVLIQGTQSKDFEREPSSRETRSESWFLQVIRAEPSLLNQGDFTEFLDSFSKRFADLSGAKADFHRAIVFESRSLQGNQAPPSSPRQIALIGGENLRGYHQSDFDTPKVFLGFIPDGRELEVISWNPLQGAYDFFLVSQMGSQNVQIKEPPRALCLSCHQNEGPILSHRTWNEMLSTDMPDHVISELSDWIKKHTLSKFSTLSPRERATEIKNRGLDLNFVFKPEFVRSVQVYDRLVRVSNYRTLATKVCRSLCQDDLNCKKDLLNLGLNGTRAEYQRSTYSNELERLDNKMGHILDPHPKIEALNHQLFRHYQKLSPKQREQVPLSIASSVVLDSAIKRFALVNGRLSFQDYVLRRRDRPDFEGFWLARGSANVYDKRALNHYRQLLLSEPFFVQFSDQILLDGIALDFDKYPGSNEMLSPLAEGSPMAARPHTLKWSEYFLASHLKEHIFDCFGLQQKDLQYLHHRFSADQVRAALDRLEMHRWPVEYSQLQELFKFERKMKLSRGPQVSVVAMGSAVTEPKDGTVPVEPYPGYDLFRKHCISCHSDPTTKVPVLPFGDLEALKSYRGRGVPSERRSPYYQIKNDRMPPEPVLTDEEIEQMLELLKP